MPSQVKSYFIHPFRGGQYSNGVADLVPADHFTAVSNAEFTVNYHALSTTPATVSLKRRLGTSRYNSVATSSQGLQWQAISDFWRYGTSLTPTQVFVGQAGATLYTDTGLTGTWLPVNTSSAGPRWGTTGADVNITPAQGFVVLSNSNSSERPQKYDQTTMNNLSTNPYQFTASVYHLRRLWGIGETASADGSAVNPSRVTYSPGGDITKFTGGDSGTFVLDEDDGDRLIGVSQPFQQQLYFFKGPQMGSIHTVWGLTPTTFQRQEIFQGLPAISHKSIITTANDLFWMSPYGIHSLFQTLRAGASQAAYLSYPIQDVIQTANYAQLGSTVGFYHPTRNLIGWAFPTGSSLTNDTCVVYHLILKRWIGTWSWNGFRASCFAVMKTPTTKRPRLYVGGYDGFVRAADQAGFSDDNGSPYTYSLTTPVHFIFPDKPEMREAQFTGADVLVRPTGVFTLTLNTTIDGSTTVTNNVDLSVGSGDLIGSTFIIGTSKIGTASAASAAPVPLEGRGRSIQFQFTQTSTAADCELFGYGVRYVPADMDSKEQT